MVFRIPRDRLFVIAEIANAHTGSAEKLARLVDKAAGIGADAIKFQLFSSQELLVADHPEIGLYKSLEIPDPEWKNIFRKLKDSNVKIFCDVFGIERARFANRLGADAFKIHSSDINNAELLQYVAKIGKPVLLSCSGCTVNEIDNAISVLKRSGNPQVVLMHGFQGFPTRISQINLNRIASLRERYGVPVGYMDHIDGGSDLALYIPLVALGLGAALIEKHITLDRSLKEEDYQSSLNPDEFARMVKMLREAWKALGTRSFEIVGDELNYRKNMKKRLVASKDLRKGAKISASDIALKRIHYSIPEVPAELVLGGRTKLPVKKDEALGAKNVELKKKKVVATIACRVTSTRLFAKPLQLVDKKKSILEFILMQLGRCKLVDEIVLAISEDPANQVFVEFARKHGLKYVRGDEENVLHRLILAAEHVGADIVLRVTSEDPFKYWQAIDAAIKQHIDSGSDYTPCVDDVPEGTGFELASLDALKRSNERGERRNRSELVTSYIREHPGEFRIKPFSVKKSLRRPEIRLTVDYPEDLILVRAIASALFTDCLPDVEKIIRSIDHKTEITSLHTAAVNTARGNNK
ncbi:MAG: N-acetylneuraminate synthase family protein [Nitrososphaera sp.]